ncbi:SH3 domain-containing protein [Paraburkholderia ferrariae]|uniref:SH3 domain-containing protein n=1 Tax=Paraburkholderia ferrariae TaxID=386056 RepID=UPI000AB25576|nr:SH3 domain-containing protein [Paraburkholderia ferrariae]
MRERQSMRARALTMATVLAACGLAAPQAFAQAQAYTSEPVDLYAGPSADYPVVSEVGPGAPVEVMGCVSDYSWCDVALPGLRGWIYGGYLTYPYQGGNVPIEGYGAVIGLPVVTFAIGAYWGSFYRDRPWYGQQEHWAHVPPPGYGGRPPGPPPPVHGGPPGGGHPPPPPPGGGHPPPPGAGAPGGPHPPQPEGNVARPPAPGPERAPAPPAAGGRPPGPAPQYGGHPPPGAQGFNHPPGPPNGGARPPGPAPGNARPEPNRGGGGGNNGRGDSRQQN